MTKYYKLPCEFQNIKNKCLHPPPLKNLREKFRKKQKKKQFPARLREIKVFKWYWMTA